MRIKEKGGRIDDDLNRFFVNKKDKKGLSITRSVGDFTGHKSGIITAEPEIKHFNLEEDDQILILASDGIWDQMTV